VGVGLPAFKGLGLLVASSILIAWGAEGILLEEFNLEGDFLSIMSYQALRNRIFRTVFLKTVGLYSKR
jgi:hypothetical protein